MIFFEFSLLQCNREQCESVVRSSILRAQKKLNICQLLLTFTKIRLDLLNLEIQVDEFFSNFSTNLRYTCVDRSVNENNPTNYIIFFVSYSNLCGI